MQKGDNSNLITTPGGRYVNFIPNVAVALGNSSSTTTATFQDGLMFVGTGGDIKVTPSGAAAGTYVTFKGIADGTILPVYVKGIHSDTTALDCVMLY
jgi:hypothetical protein